MEIDKLQIKIETDSVGAVNGLKELKKVLYSLKRLGKSTELDDLATKLEKISKIRFDNLKQINMLGETFKQVKRLTREVNDLSKKISNIPDVVDVTADTSGVSDAMSDIDPVWDTTSTTKNITVGVDTPGMDVARKKASGFRNVLDRVRAATTKVSAGLKSMTGWLRNTASNFSRTTKKASTLAQVLKIVVVYGGAFRAFMLITQGVSEGLQNVAQYNTETAAAMSRLSTMALYLKNSIGAALYPVIVALTPALQAMTNAIVRVFEAMGQLVSMLSGKTTYLKAKEYLKSYVDTAKGAAKQIKKSFAGMDEITVIGEKDSGSSGGGGSEDYGSMFEEVPIDNPKLQALLPFFQGLGAVLSSCFDTIKQLANDYLYPWLVNIGNWCSENPDTLEVIGKGLAYIGIGLLVISGVTRVFKPITSFFSAVGGFKNGVGILAAAFGAFIQIFAAVDAWTNGTTWENLGKQLAGIGIVIASLTMLLGSVGTAVSSIVGGIILVVTSVKDWLENGASWENFLGVMVGLAAIFGGISLLVGSWIPMAIGAIVATVVAIIMWWDEISAFFVNLWNSIVGFFASIVSVVGEFLGGIVSSVIEFFSGIASWVYDNVLLPIILFFTPFVDAICGYFSIIWHYISTVFTAIYEVISYIIGKIIEIVSGIAAAVWAVVSKIYEIISTIVQMIWAVISWMFGLIWDFISGIASWIWDNALKPIVDFVTDLATKIVEKLTEVAVKIKTKVIDPIVNFFKGMIDTVVGFFKNIAIKVVDAISGTFKSVLNGVFSIVEKVVNFFIKGINGAIGIINNIPGVNIKKIEVLSIPRFATGGFPEDGLFMANHGELVGRFSNGKTAVANNEQIVDGIAGGVYVANQEQNGLLREQNKLLRQLVDSRSNGQIDVTTITSAMQRKNRRDGKTIVPVGI